LATLAWIRQATGDTAGALDAIGEAGRVAPSLAAADLSNPVPSQRARLLLAACGDHASALGVLTEALTLGCPQGYVRVFADEGAPMRALLAELPAARPGHCRHHSRKFAKALRAYPSTPVGSPSGARHPLVRG